MRLRGIVVVAAIVGLSAPALAGSPFALCRKLGTSDRLRPLPSSLTGAACELFGLAAMPPQQIRRTTLWRCMEGHVLLCNLGANLPCGKADTRHQLPAADAWCAGHPDSAFIPRYVTGHATIYRWRCAGGRAATVGRGRRIDRRGFIARFWKQADQGRAGQAGSLCPSGTDGRAQ